MPTLTACAQLLWHALMLGLPMAAGVLVAQHRGVTRVALLIGIGMGTLGLAGMITFWAYLPSPGFGRVVAIALEVLSAAVVGYEVAWRRGGRQLATALGRPSALYLSTSMWITAVGFLYGPLHLAARFLPSLPVDDAIPLLFARQLQSTHRPLPHLLVANWQSSDRPPLQTGIYLLDQGFVRSSSYTHYELVGILCESLWVFGLWAIFTAFGIGPKLRALATAVVGFSGFVIVNSFYTWPKLLPGAFLLIVVALALDRAAERKALTWVTAGVAVGMAMLSHPGSAFIVIALVVTMLVVRISVPLRPALFGAGAAVVCYLPWIWYQNYYDPPGTKLDMLQLAAVGNVPRGLKLTTAIKHAYRSAGLHKVVHNKIANWEFPFNNSIAFFRAAFSAVAHGPNSSAALDLRADFFYFLIPSLGLMAWGIVAFVVAFVVAFFARGRVPRRLPPAAATFCRDAVVLLVISYLVWGFVLFGPNATAIHVGSYLVPLLALTVGCFGLWHVSPRAATVAGSAQVALGIYLYAGVDPNRIPSRLGATRAAFVTHTSATGVVVVVIVSLLTAATYGWIALGRDALPGALETEGLSPLPATAAGQHDDDRRAAHR